MTAISESRIENECHAFTAVRAKCQLQSQGRYNVDAQLLKVQKERATESYDAEKLPCHILPEPIFQALIPQRGSTHG